MELKFYKIMMVVSVCSLAACSKMQFSSSSSSGTTTTTTTDTTGATTTTTTTVSTTTTGTACYATPTVPLQISSVGALSDYAEQALINPVNIAATINLHNTGDGHYYGSVQISYTDSGLNHDGVFTAAPGANISIPSLKDNGTLTSAYNYWYNSSTNFSGFFQDTYGALVMSVTSVDANGCASGNLYYKNFIITPATNIQSPYRDCWFIYAGPYQCGSSTIMNKSSVVPSDGYNFLGSFSGLPVTQAFQ